MCRFECVCVAGTLGARCEVNVDECASAPCGHGKCVDGIGGYDCECLPGYEGEHCEVEIDECQRYAPCAHGRCFDGRASYFCACEPGWGGRNCSVVLTGCRGAPCRNNGTCLPWLQDETRHRFNCSCAPGHYGTTCEKVPCEKPRPAPARPRRSRTTPLRGCRSPRCPWRRAATRR